MQAKNKRHSPKSSPALGGLKTKHHIVAGLEAELLRRVRTDESMSRVELARRLKLAPSTVSIYVDRLIDDGFLVEKEKVERAFGRPPKALGLHPDGGHFIGIDFEARNIMATAVDFSQKPIKRAKEKIQASDTVDVILGKIDKAICQVRASERALLAIGIGVPGSIDHEKGVALHYRHIAGWDNIPLAEQIGRRFSVPVFLENNIRSMALAELWFGEGRGVDNFICIGVRSGVGAGIIIGGHLYRGSQNLAGEIADWPCSAGRGRQSFTRLEDIVSMRAIENGSFENAARMLGLALAQLNYAFNPEKIILAGAITAFGQPFADQVKQGMSHFSDSLPAPNIVNSSLGDFNGALGAAALAVHHWKPVRK